MNTAPDFSTLETAVRTAGLYKRTYAPYALLGLLIVCGLAVSVVVMMRFSDSIIIQFLNAIFLGIVFVQAGMLSHDLSHGQVFDSPAKNLALSLIIWPLVCGLSSRGWYEKHNAHHKHVNNVGLDPDLEIPFVFSSVQLEGKSSFVKRYIVPYQRWLFFVMLPFVYPNFVLWSVRDVLFKRDARGLIEGCLIVLHFIFFFGVPFLLLPPLQAALLCGTTVLVIGAYMSAVFAPNHKGEEVVAGRPTLWTDQILLTRNIHTNPLTFHMLGGLDLQIEHHLFPGVSRYQYPRVQSLVKEFCAREGLEYYETTWIGSMKEIYDALNRESSAAEVGQRIASVSRTNK